MKTVTAHTAFSPEIRALIDPVDFVAFQVGSVALTMGLLVFFEFTLGVVVGIVVPP